MDLNVYLQLIFLSIVNIIFTISGIVLNMLVIASFLKSSLLRKKLCHFIIMLLSCFDLASVVTNHPGLLFYLVTWLREDYDSLPNVMIYLNYSVTFLAYSLLALLVMNIERYLGTYHPIFHRTSVTRRKLIAFLAILLIFQTTIKMISTNDLVISRSLNLIIFIVVVFLPLVFINFKLFKISRETRRKRARSPEKRATMNLKGISTCLSAVACLAILSIPTIAYILFNVITESKQVSTARLSYIWTTTIYTMNSTFNSVIFFWKNKVLRTEGLKTVQALKDRLIRSQARTN